MILSGPVSDRENIYEKGNFHLLNDQFYRYGLYPFTIAREKDHIVELGEIMQIKTTSKKGERVS
jgi:hypothetical protein